MSKSFKEPFDVICKSEGLVPYTDIYIAPHLAGYQLRCRVCNKESALSNTEYSTKPYQNTLKLPDLCAYLCSEKSLTIVERRAIIYASTKKLHRCEERIT